MRQAFESKEITDNLLDKLLGDARYLMYNVLCFTYHHVTFLILIFLIPNQPTQHKKTTNKQTNKQINQ